MSLGGGPGSMRTPGGGPIGHRRVLNVLMKFWVAAVTGSSNLWRRKPQLAAVGYIALAM